jgi:hypothetical protein
MTRKPTCTDQDRSDKLKLNGINEGYMQMMQHNGQSGSRLSGATLIANPSAGYFDRVDMALARSRGQKSSTNTYTNVFDDDDGLLLVGYGGGTTLDVDWTSPVGEELQGIGGWIESTLVTAKRESFVQSLSALRI